MPPDTAPHLESDDLKNETEMEQHRLRASAVREAELGPLLDRVTLARRLLLQMAGFIASNKLDLPAAVDQELASWLHADALERKERK